MVPKYSSFQELSNDMFYKGIASTMTDIGPQRVTPLGALLKIISIQLLALGLKSTYPNLEVHRVKYTREMIFNRAPSGVTLCGPISVMVLAIPL